MPRQPRVDEAGMIYHALNPGNRRQTIFHKDADYEAFIRALAEGLGKYAVEIFAFTLMPNHWHLVLRPASDGQMGAFLRWVAATHTLRYHPHYHTRGQGYLYQARFKSFPIRSDEHFFVVCRHVELNPVRAKLVDSAKRWPYGSLYRWNRTSEPEPIVLSPWPIRRLPNWNRRVDSALTAKELAEIWIFRLPRAPLGHPFLPTTAQRIDEMEMRSVPRNCRAQNLRVLRASAFFKVTSDRLDNPIRAA
jgi:putative transposase